MIPVKGDFTLVAKERFGGPAADGEYSGRLDELHLPIAQGSEEVTIVVNRKEQP